MDNNPPLEVWMRGPIADVPTLLQPVAHALLQVKEDIFRYTKDVHDSQLWIKPYGLASIGFHLQHIAGVIDRMFTYAHNKGLSEAQFDSLNKEGKENTMITLSQLLSVLHDRIDAAIRHLQNINPSSLSQTRYLGRKRIPTTLIGLLFHASEHSQRHVGQLLVTVRYILHEGTTDDTSLQP